MLQVGPGLGKSRIWAMLVCMLSCSKFKKFRVLFTDHVLQERENTAIKTLKTIKINVCAYNLVDMQRANISVIDGEEDELVILDEADTFILDYPIEINAPNIVGLTATALDDLEDDSAK